VLVAVVVQAKQMEALLVLMVKIQYLVPLRLLVAVAEQDLITDQPLVLAGLAAVVLVVLRTQQVALETLLLHHPPKVTMVELVLTK
jgi:hypothetical protein